MKYVDGEPHIVTALSAVSTAIESIKMLPKCDIVVQIDDILRHTVDILIDFCEDSEISPRELERFVDYTDEIKREMRKLNAASKR
jgi:hypothetical protein